MKTLRILVAVIFMLTVVISLYSVSTAKSENDFYRSLVKKEIATRADLIRCVARFKGFKGSEDIIDELTYLSETVDISFPSNIVSISGRPVTKGETANMFLNAMGKKAVKRGIMGRFFRNSKRYAARDGIAQKLLPGGSFANEYISGAELLTTLARAVEQSTKGSGS